MALSNRLKSLKKKATNLIPDDAIEDALDRARSFVTDNASGVARAGARAVYEAPVMPNSQSIKGFRASYDRTNREISDPLREITQIAGEEDFNPVATAKRSYQTQRDTGLGESFRARPNTLGKRVIENVIDPLNLIPVGTSLVGAKAAGAPITRALIRASIREMAAPAAGQIGGYYAGKAVGGKTGAQVGEFAGLLAGGFGPNLVRGAEESTAAAVRRSTSNDRVPGTAIVPVEVARQLPGEARVPDDAEFRQALSMTPGGMLWSRDGVIANVDRYQQTGMGNQPTLRGGVYYAPNRSSYKGAIGDFEGGPEQVSGKTIFRRPLVVRGQYVTSGLRDLFGTATRSLEQAAAHVAIVAGQNPPNVFDPERAEALRRSGTETALRQFLDQWVEAGDREDAFTSLYSHLLRAKERPSNVSLSMAGAYPLIERVMGNEARRQGYDSIMAMARQDVRLPSGKISNQPYIEEIMDLREATYPTPEGGFTLRPEFAPAQTPRGAMGLMPAAPTDRFYHGTGSTFDRPDAARFDANGLFGPGYYLTSDARVAGSYSDARTQDALGATLNPLSSASARDMIAKADAGIAALDPSDPKSAARRAMFENMKEAGERALQYWEHGPNIRPVDVPRDLRLLDAEAEMKPAQVRRFAQQMAQATGSRYFRDLGETPARELSYLSRRFAGMVDEWRQTEPMDWTQANRALSSIGYDGIRYDGGKRIPLKDDAGNPITHTAVVIFPESLDKLTNALSGTPGGLLPAPQPAGRSAREILGFDRAGLKADLTAAGFGAAANVGREVVFEDERDPRELAKAAGFGALAGASGAHIARLQRDLLPVSRITGESGSKGIGRVAEAFGMDPSKRYEFRYRVADLDDLIPSHTDTMALNPRFPQELQPRLRDRAASQLQVDQIARKLEPDALLSDVRQIDRGPMIVGADNVVESGNGRVLALRRARSEYPEQFGKYREQLRSRAAEYGINPADLEGIKNPVLVRERITPVDRAAFAQEANQAAVLGMSPFEQALTDAQKLSDDLLAGITVGERQSLDAALQAPANRRVAEAFIGALSPNERASLIDASGALNAAGLQRLKAALFARTYPGEAGQRLTGLFFESLDPSMKSIEQALYASLPDLSRAEALIRNGDRVADLSLSDDLSKAANALNRLREEGVSVGDYLRQQAMFERELTPFQEQLLQFLDANRRKPTQIRGALKAYAEVVNAQPHPSQAGIFGDVSRATKGELFDGAVRTLDPNAIDEAAGIFATSYAKESAAPMGAASAPESARAATAERPQLAGAARIRAEIGETVPPPPRQPPPVADAVPPVDPQQSRGVMRSLLSLSREINLGGDIGQFLRTFMLGGAQAVGENPVGAVGKGRLPNALYKGLRALVSDGYAQRYQQEEAFRRFGGFFNPAAARVEEGGPSIAGGVLAGFQERHTILGAPFWPFIQADRAVFDRFNPVFGSEAAKIIADGLPRRLTEGATPAQVDAWVGERLRNLIVGPSLSENATSVVNNAVNKVSDVFPFISPRRVRGEVRNVTQLGNFSTPEGHLARRFWAGATFSAVAASVGMTTLLTGKSPAELLDPRDEDSVVNPANWNRFLGVELPNGTVIKPFASYQPVARLFLQPAADALGKGYEATQAQEGFLAAAGVALDEWLKSSGTQFQKYGANRLALPARLASEAVLFNKDYSGLPIRTADSAIEQLGQVGLHGLRSQVPAFAQAFTQRDRPVVPGTEPTTRQNLIDTALNWAFNISPTRPPNLPPDVEATLRAEVERRGGDPGNDPLRAFYDLNLPQNERERFEAQNPHVLDFFNQRTLVQEPTIAGPRGKQATTAYTWARKAAAQERDERLRALEEKNLPGDEYRRQREGIMNDYQGDLRGAQLAIFKTNNRDEVDAIVKKAYAGHKSTDQELDDTIEAYYAIRPTDDSRDAQDAFFAERDAFLDGLRPDLRKKFDETLEARAAQISQTELAYHRAQKVYQEYNRLPTYKGMTADESREASRIAQEARDYAQFSGKSASSYLLRRRDLTPMQKRNARKALSGAKYVNPARKRFMQQHSGSFARFYSSLSQDLVEQITTPDPRLAFLNG